MNFCSECGYKLTSSENFCPECGNRLLRSSPVLETKKQVDRDEAVQRARILSQEGHLDSAAQLLVPFAESGDLEAMDLMGLVSHDLGDFNAAVNWFSRVAEAGVCLLVVSAAHRAIGSDPMAVSTEGRQLARRYLSIAEKFDDPEAQALSAHICMLEKDYDCAVSLWTRIISLNNPEYPGIVDGARNDLEWLLQSPEYAIHVLDKRV